MVGIIKDVYMEPTYAHEEDGTQVELYPGWADFKRELRKKFFPPHVQKRKRTEFEKLEQGTGTVQSYYEKFMELA